MTQPEDAPVPAELDQMSDEDLLQQVCREKRIPLDLIIRLKNLEERYSEVGRRHGIAGEMRDLVRQALDDLLERKS